MGAIDDVLAHAERYAESFSHGDLPAPPARRLAVLTCMDARMDAHAILGLAPGDAHVIRNAGGVVTDDEIRSLAVSQRLLGTEEVMVIQHTRCGMTSFSDEEFAEQLERDTGERPAWRARAFTDLDDSVRATVREIRESPFVAVRTVRGFVYDIESGRLREVA